MGVSGEYVLNHIHREVRLSLYHVSGKNLSVSCPSCGKGDNHFAIRVDNLLYNCFSCGFSGSLSEKALNDKGKWNRIRSVVMSSPAVSAVDNAVDAGHISRDLWEILGTHGPLHPDNDVVPMSSHVRRATEYCIKRGMSAHQISSHKVCVNSKLVDGRVYFPFWSEEKTVNFWVARAMNPNTLPKTLEPKGTDKPLFGIHVRSLAASGVMFLVEGIFDYVVTPHSFCLLGSGVSENQMETIRKIGPRFVVNVFDFDAVSKARKISQKFWRNGIKCVSVRLPDRRDPNELGFPVMYELVKVISDRDEPPRPCVWSVPSLGC